MENVDFQKEITINFELKENPLRFSLKWMINEIN